MDNRLEKQRMATLINSPEIAKMCIDSFPEDSWLLDGNKFLWDKIRTHYKLNNQIPTNNILYAYVTSKQKIEHLELSATAAKDLLSEYEKQSPEDLEFFRNTILKDASDTRIKNAILSAVDTKDWGKLKNDLETIELQGRSKERRVYSLMDIQKQRASGGDVLLNDGLLCRKEGMIIAGSQGCGKSILVTQLAMAWAQGKETLGFKPTKPLKILILQCEDGQHKVEKMVDSISSRIGSCGNNVIQIDETYPSAQELFNNLSADMETHKPDIVIINPFFAYLQGDMNDNKTTQSFLYNQFTTLLHKHNAAGIIVHHLTKDKINVYGSAVLGAWARAVVRLDETDAVNHVFKLGVDKRAFEYGNSNCHIQWSDEGMFWEMVDLEEVGRGNKINWQDLFSTGDSMSAVELWRSGLFKGQNFSLKQLRRELNAAVKIGQVEEVAGRNASNQPTTYYKLRVSNN